MVDTLNSEIQAQALKLLESLPELDEWAKDAGPNRRAFVIEFAGMPKAGKSTAIENLRHFFSHGPRHARIKTIMSDEYQKGFKVHTPAEGVSLRTPNFLRTDLFDFNTWAGSYALQELLQARHDQYYDIVVLDRGPWDAGCWLSYVTTHLRDKIDDRENAEEVCSFFQLPRWTSLSDLHVVLVVDPEEAKKREEMQRLIPHDGTSSNSAMMSKMLEIYSDRFQALMKSKASICPHVGEHAALLIDTTGLTDKQIALRIIERVFEVVRLKNNSRYLLEISTLQKLLASYTSGAIEGEITAVNAFLPGFIDKANSMPVQKRRFLSGRLYDLAIDEQLINNRKSKQGRNVMIDRLNDLLSEAQRAAL